MAISCFWLAVSWKKKFSETTCSNDLLVDTNIVCEVLYKKFSFHFDPVKNITAMGNSSSTSNDLLFGTNLV